jgi:hypothetical protein
MTAISNSFIQPFLKALKLSKSLHQKLPGTRFRWQFAVRLDARSARSLVRTPSDLLSDPLPLHSVALIFGSGMVFAFCQKASSAYSNRALSESRSHCYNQIRSTVPIFQPHVLRYPARSSFPGRGNEVVELQAWPGSSGGRAQP